MTFVRMSIFLCLLAVALVAIPPAYHLSQGNLLLASPEPAEKTDAIIVFTGDPDRISEGYREYIDGTAEKIMVTGNDFAVQASEPDVRELAKQIRKDDIYVDLEATNTIENAEHVAKWAQWQQVESISLVTSEDHMPRAFFELRRLLPDHIALYPNPIPGDLKYAGVDSEKSRLLCRLYETVTDKDFCYQAREFARHIGL